jgi:hypothetical protein
MNFYQRHPGIHSEWGRGRPAAPRCGRRGMAEEKAMTKNYEIAAMLCKVIPTRIRGKSWRIEFYRSRNHRIFCCQDGTTTARKEKLSA